MHDHEQAADILRAFRLIHDLQAGDPDAPGLLAALATRAREEGWGELERACVFGRAVQSWMAGDGHAAPAVAELVELSGAAGDTVMLALGLALQAEQGFSGEDLVGAAAYDGNLARALIMLEQESGRPCERITAHTACAIALGNRWLFELSEEQYGTALAIGAREPTGRLDFLLAPIHFDLAEQQVSWASKLFEMGDDRGVADRLEAWNQLVAATASYPISERWQLELDALGLVLRAMAGHPVIAEADRLLARAGGAPQGGGRATGLLRVAVAVETARADREGNARDHAANPPATAAVEAAVAAISPAVHPFMHDLALFLAAMVEARSDREAGLRYARRAVSEQWARRVAALRAMRAHIASVRLTTERDLLSRHARLDDLTGIANRRALEEFLSDLLRRDVERCALVLFDVDSFKGVNDRHGHLVGDRVLVHIAQVLARGVRSSDLAVRLGGDEFAVLLGGVDARSAPARAHALVRAFDNGSLEDIAPGLALRVSAGVATGTPAAIMAIWAAADAALYEAKAAGGHVVRVAPDMDV